MIALRCNFNLSLSEAEATAAAAAAALLEALILFTTTTPASGTTLVKLSARTQTHTIKMLHSRYDFQRVIPRHAMHLTQ